MTVSVSRRVLASSSLLWLVAACAGKSSSLDAAAGQAGASTSLGGASGGGGGGAAGALPPNDPANFACPIDQVCTPTGGRAQVLPSPTCPPSQPAEGSACTSDGLSCSYGESVTGYCRNYLSCVGDRWKTPDNRQDVCVMQPAGFCPPLPTQGAACEVGDVDVFVACEYAAGVACYCLGNPVGITGAPGSWECYGPPRNAACPELLPNLGDGCSENGQVCHYGIQQQGCLAPYADVSCYRGAWEASQALCTL